MTHPLIRAIGDLAWLHLYRVDELPDDALDETLLAPYRRVRRSRTLASPGGAWLQATLLRSALGDCWRIPLFLPFDLRYVDRFTFASNPEELAPLQLTMTASIRLCDVEDVEETITVAAQSVTLTPRADGVELRVRVFSDDRKKLHAFCRGLDSTPSRVANELQIGFRTPRVRALDPPTIHATAVWREDPLLQWQSSGYLPVVWFKTGLWHALPATLIHANRTSYRPNHESNQAIRSRWAASKNNGAHRVIFADQPILDHATPATQVSFLDNVEFGINAIPIPGSSKFIDHQWEEFLGFPFNDPDQEATLKLNVVLEAGNAGQEITVPDGVPVTYSRSEFSGAELSFSSELSPLHYPEGFGALSEKTISAAIERDQLAHVQTYSMADRTASVEAWWKVREFGKADGKSFQGKVTRLERVLGDTRTTPMEPHSDLKTEARQTADRVPPVYDPCVLERLPSTGVRGGGDRIQHLVITDLDYWFRNPDPFFQTKKESDELRKKVEGWIEKSLAVRKEVLRLALELWPPAGPSDQEPWNILSDFVALRERLESMTELEGEQIALHQNLRTSLGGYVAGFPWAYDDFTDLVPDWYESLIRWFPGEHRPAFESRGMIFINVGRSLPITVEDPGEVRGEVGWDCGGMWHVLRDLKCWCYGEAGLERSPVHCFADRVVVVISAHLLRASGARIGHRLSWEHAAEDCWDALQHNPCLRPLLGYGYLIVRFGCAGAMVFSNRIAGTKASKGSSFLVYDPGAKKGYFRDPDEEGAVLGANSTLIASAVRAVMQAEKESNDLSGESLSDAILRGVREGIARVQWLFQKGYEPFVPAATYIEQSDRIAPGSSIPLLQSDAAVELFADRVTSEYRNQSVRFAGVQGWRIIDSFSPPELLESAVNHVMRSAGCDGNQVRLRVGSNNVELPTAKFGSFVAVERLEVEAFQSARAILRRYVDGTKGAGPESKPLSLAVFGPPGSGKSFGVRELAESISKTIVWQNCNLAQFSAPSDLVIPLLKARDAGANKVPVVFFDEFDSKLGDTPLGWLRYLLQPMQDGEFKHGEEIRRLGRVVFIFAGGTSSTFREFSRDAATESEVEEFRLAKGPDFVSRLSSYIDTMGIKKSDDRKDSGYVLRRAILLRSLIVRDGLIGTDGNSLVHESFVRMLLELSSLKHGARSLDQLLKMCIGENGRLRLPAISQLEIHIDRKEAEMLCSNISSRHY